MTTAVAVAVGLALVGYFFFSNPFAPNMQPQGQAGAPDQVVIQDVAVGNGAQATIGSKIVVNYIGKLQDGTIFDQSSSHGGAQQFSLDNNMIAGFVQGVAGMKEGGTRVVIIPPSLGYGNRAVGSIPPNSTLIFQVELVKVENPSSQ